MDNFVNLCVVTYNRLEYTKQCIEELLQLTNYPYKLVVVDNASGDGTKEYITEMYERGSIDRIVLLEKNIGLSKAGNIGWALYPEAAYYVRLDNDMIAKSVTWLDDMVEILESTTGLGMLGYNVENTSYPLVEYQGKKVRLKANGNLGGGCVFIPKYVNEKLGYWTEDYGLYGEEDADYSIRLRLAGYFFAYMENENAFYHLPGGKAAVINPVTYRTEYSQESEFEAAYREWKDDHRQNNVLSGLFSVNYILYRNQLRSLYISSPALTHWAQSLRKSLLAKSAPILSIVIITWKRSEMLFLCLTELFSKLYYKSDFEIIIGLNQPDSDTLEVVKQFYFNKIVVSEKNEGVQLYFSLYAKTKGKYVITVDDDVLQFPEAFDKKMIEYLEFYKDYEYLSLNVVQNELTSGARPSIENYNLDYRGDKKVLEGSAGGWCAIGHGPIIRRIVPEKIEDISFYIGEDAYINNVITKVMHKKVGVIESLICLHASDATYSSYFSLLDRDTEKYSVVGLEDSKNGYISFKNSLNKSTQLAIIIPVFNKWEFTRVCIESLERTLKFDTIEVIVVDNASTDETQFRLQEMLKKKPWLKYIRNIENFGFSKACNIGAYASNSNNILFLNNDTEAIDGWLDPLIKIIESDPTVGIVGSKLLYKDETIQHAGVGMLFSGKNPADPLMANHLYAHSEKERQEANLSWSYQAVTGACLMVRAGWFKTNNGFDENYWNGYEDVDLCLRAIKSGYKVVYVPESVLYHFESKSGPERFLKATQNISLLHKHWIGKALYDFIKEEDSIVQNPNCYFQRYYYNTIAVVVPHYGELKYLALFVESLKSAFDKSIELIVVNNAGDKESGEYLMSLRKDFTLMKVITPEHNLGFPKSINEGLRIANSRYILIANNDIVLPPNTLTRLLTTLESNKDYGMVGPVSNSVSGLQIVDDAAYSSLDEMSHYAVKRREEFKNTKRIFPRIAFLCTLIKREVIERIGLLDERFTPGNFEDDDYCLRVQLAGYKTVIDDSVFIHHFGSVNFKKNGNDAYKNLIEVNRKKFVGKWGADPNQLWLENMAPKNNTLLIQSTFNKVEDALKTAAEFLKHGDYEGALYYYSEALSGLQNRSEYHTQFAQVTNLVKKLSEMLV